MGKVPIVRLIAEPHQLQAVLTGMGNVNPSILLTPCMLANDEQCMKLRRPEMFAHKSEGRCLIFLLCEEYLHTCRVAWNYSLLLIDFLGEESVEFGHFITLTFLEILLMVKLKMSS